jgi:hypothetical protein
MKPAAYNIQAQHYVLAVRVTELDVRCDISWNVGKTSTNDGLTPKPDL